MGLKKFLVKPPDTPSRGKAKFRRGNPVRRPVQLFMPQELEKVKQHQSRGWHWVSPGWFFHPSSLGEECDRALLLGMAGLRAPVTDRLIRIWDEGKCMHFRWTGYFRETGQLIRADVPVKNLTYLVQGTADLLITLASGDPGLGEMKSIKDNRCARLPSPSEDPRENIEALLAVDHRSVVVQWTVYAAELAPRGFILFENKDTQEPLWYPMQVIDFILLPIRERFLKLKPKIQAHLIPAIFDDIQRCLKCDLQPVCSQMPQGEHPFQKITLPGEET